MPDAPAQQAARTIERTGALYLEQLADGRHVTIDGERISNVATHPALRGAAHTLAALLDLHHNPRTRAAMTSTTADGVAIPRCYSLATSQREVAGRGHCFETMARATGGLMGRSPDFLATLLASWSAAADVFGRRDSRFAENIRAYHRSATEQALCHTHAISDPPADGATRGVAPLALRRIGRSADGITVRGMKMLATLAPFADELLVYPFRPLRPEEDDQALAIAVPLDAPGLRIVCRPPLARGERSFERPLTERFDEMDALCVFDDVFVPHERVFIDGDVELANVLRAETGMTAYLWHQTATRTAVKAELVLGTASLVARASGRVRDGAVREKLGEMAAIAEALAALVVAAEAASHEDRFGFHVPRWAPLGASGVLTSQLYPRLIELLQLVGSSGLVMHPTAADMEAAHAPVLAAYFNGSDGDLERHGAILKLAADLAISGFAGRQLLYERFYLGPAERLRERFYENSDLERAERLAERLLVPADA